MKVLIVAATLLCGACSNTTGPIAATDTRFTPDSVYAAWWARDLACSGLPGADLLPQLAWWEVHATSLDHPGANVAARTYWPQRDIRIATSYLGDERVVRHEMLHALLYAAGKRHESELHDPTYFVQRCNVL